MDKGKRDFSDDEAGKRKEIGIIQDKLQSQPDPEKSKALFNTYKEKIDNAAKDTDKGKIQADVAKDTDTFSQSS